MTTAGSRELVRRYCEEVVNTGDTSSISEFLAEDYAEVHDGKRYPIGITGATEHVRGVRGTYPDLHLTIERQIAEGGWVVTQVTMRGTHLGEWMGIRPTGKSIAVTAVILDRVVGGRIVGSEPS